MLRAFEELDWKVLENFGRNRQGLIGSIRDTLNGHFVSPVPGVVALDCRPRDGPVLTDLTTFAKALAAEFLT